MAWNDTLAELLACHASNIRRFHLFSFRISAVDKHVAAACVFKAWKHFRACVPSLVRSRNISPCACIGVSVWDESWERSRELTTRSCYTWRACSEETLSGGGDVKLRNPRRSSEKNGASLHCARHEAAIFGA